MMTADDRELLQLFVEDLTDYAVVILDPQGDIRTWNAGARALLGYAEEEIVGRRFSELFTKADIVTGQSSAALKDALQWGRHEATCRFVRKDGSRFEAKIVLRPLSGGRQRFAGYGMIAYEAPESKRTPAAEPRGGKLVALNASAKILVVDDDKHVREHAADELARLGYGVVSAGSGEEALAVLQREDDIDLLFTDVVMPGSLAGRALAAKAIELRPGLKVLFASGYFEGALVGRGDLETDVQFLMKPYVRKELAQKVEAVLKSTS
jgi:PAS domain S-box-containing protein